PPEMLRSIGDVLRRHRDVLVLSDDIYAPLNYTGKSHVTLAAECPDLADRIVTISGVSKSHPMPGFGIALAARSGWPSTATATLVARFGHDAALVLHLLDHGVAVVPASAFGGQDVFRISFAADDEQLAEAVRRIAKAVA